MNRHAALGWLAGVALVMTCGTAGAFDGYAAFPWYGYGNNGPAAYALGNIAAPPYFALHPPVYYSRPVPRSYGHSPFACTCDCHHHGQPMVAPRITVNPHVEAKPATPAKKSEPKGAKPAKIAAAAPVRIANPYYHQHDRQQVLAQGQ